MSPHSIEGYLLCKKLYKVESDTPPSPCKMAEGRKKRFLQEKFLRPFLLIETVMMKILIVVLI